MDRGNGAVLGEEMMKLSEDIAPSDWLPGNARPPRSQKKRSWLDSAVPKSPEPSGEWEHKLVRVPGRNQKRAHEKALNKMTDQGWELVSINWGGLLRSTDVATFRRKR